MKRIDSINKAVDLFGPGKHGFQGGNPSLNLPATFLTPDWCNHIQEEISNVIEAAGGALNDGLKNQLYTAIQALTSAAVPAGAIIYFPLAAAPSGFVKANGAALSRTTYSQLFGAISTLFGAGDGSTTFNVPDLRAEFIRGLDDGRGIDTGRALGSNQADSIPNHQHQWWTTAFGGGITLDGTGWSTQGSWNSSGSGIGFGDPVNGDIYTSPNVYNVAGENHPRNIALLACIKY